MVLFYDLSASSHPHSRSSSTAMAATSTAAARERLNREHPLSRLLAAYPFLAGIAPWLDRTDLENLSTACWQFRENMGQYRSGLLRASLKCCEEGVGEDAGGEEEGGGGGEVGWRSFRGGSRCVRDMVAGCRRCGRPYCRNCIQKPSKTTLDCRSVPLCSPCGDLPPHPTTPPPCRCDSTTWICQSCVNARWYVDGRLCLLCHGNADPTRKPYRGDFVARAVCTWCNGMVWSARDMKDIEDMEALETPATSITTPTMAATATPTEKEEGGRRPDAFLSFSFW